MELQKLKFVNKSTNPDPQYAKPGDSGFDLVAWITSDDEKAIKIGDSSEYAILLNPLERRKIHTGLYFDLPKNTELQVRTRSGMASKFAICVANSPGTCDESYTGEVCIIIINLSNDVVKITNGDRIAQAVLMPVYNKELVDLTRVERIEKQTERGQNGFGHTGF